MSRLIDADALRKQTIKKLHITNSLKDITDLIDEAPTIEPCKSTDQNVADVPSGDLISRAEAIEAVKETKPIVRSTERNWGKMIAEQHSKELVKALKALPSADRPSNVLQEKKPTPIEDYMIGKSRSADRPQVDYDSAEEQIAETEQKLNRPKGEWLDVEHEPYCECSVCGAYIENLDDDFAFCPRCGADMRPEK